MEYRPLPPMIPISAWDKLPLGKGFKTNGDYTKTGSSEDLYHRPLTTEDTEVPQRYIEDLNGTLEVCNLR
jgi:hypothetical protein